MEAAENGTLVKVDRPATQGAIILKDALETAAEQRGLLVRFVKEQMVEGVDYGTIPGTPKPCLYKPGAEKLTELYRSSVKFSISKEIEDWEKGFFYYRIKAQVVNRDSDAVLGVGLGSCNSRETKYRWRDSKVRCPKCNGETVFKSKNDGGWFCWARQGGCGAQFGENDKGITEQPRGRVENPDIADLVNTILKMATKRAHVAAALQLAGCSDLFTQDLEDLVAVDEPKGEPTKTAAPKEAPKESPKEATPAKVAEPEKTPVPKKDAAKKDAPVNTQSAALRSRILKVWNEAQKDGFKLEQFQKLAKDTLGHDKPSSEWAENDVAHMEETIRANRAAMQEPGANG